MCSQDSKEQAYKTFVRPTLEYASTVWDPHTARNINAVEMVQRRAARCAARFTKYWWLPSYQQRIHHSERTEVGQLTASQGQSSYHHVIPNTQQTGRHSTRGVLGTIRHPYKRSHYKVPPAAGQNPSIPVLLLSVYHQILELSTSTSCPDQLCWGIQTESGRHQHHLDHQPVTNFYFYL